MRFLLSSRHGLWSCVFVLVCCACLIAPQITAADASDPLPSPLYQQSLEKSIDRFEQQDSRTQGAVQPDKTQVSRRLPGGSGGAVVAAPQTPLLDCYNSDGHVIISLDPTDPTCSNPDLTLRIDLSGETQTQRDAPPYADGQSIQTEIISMDLAGTSPMGPVTVRAGTSFGLPPSRGAINGVTVDPDGNFVGSTDSFFDIFFEIQIGSLPPAHNDTPERVETGPTTQIPPYCTNYDPVGTAESVPLLNASGQLSGWICFVRHHPVNPCPQCIYRLVCASGPADELGALGLCIDEERALYFCPTKACLSSFNTIVGNVCLWWQWTTRCELTNLAPVPGVVGDCNCDPFAPTLPSSPTCPGEPSCPGTATCGDGATCLPTSCDAPTCFDETCVNYLSCHGSATCPGFYTCIGGATCAAIETCSPVTCTAEPTCAGSEATCSPNETCAYYPTCEGTETCGANVATCVGSATCRGSGTCHGAPTCTVTPTYEVGPDCDTPTMSGGPSCHGSSTCDGFFTCMNATCAAIETCQSVTCTAEPTCWGSKATCSPNPTCPFYPSCAGTETCGAAFLTCIGSESCPGSATCESAPTCDPQQPTMSGTSCAATICLDASCDGSPCPPTMAGGFSCTDGACPTSGAMASCANGNCQTIQGSVSCPGGNCQTVQGAPSCRLGPACPTGIGWPSCGFFAWCPKPTSVAGHTCPVGLLPCPTSAADWTCPGDPSCIPTVAPKPSCGATPTCPAVPCNPPTIPGAATCPGGATCPGTATCPPFGATCVGVATCPPFASCGALTCPNNHTCPGFTTCVGTASCQSGHTCASNVTCGTQPTCSALQQTCDHSPTCGLQPSCAGWPTCTGEPTCSDAALTCGPNPTCQGEKTCPGAITCDVTATCDGAPTCRFAFTCDGWPTCQAPPYPVPNKLLMLTGALELQYSPVAGVPPNPVHPPEPGLEYDNWHGQVHMLMMHPPSPCLPPSPCVAPPIGSFFDVFYNTRVKSAVARTDTVRILAEIGSSGLDGYVDVDGDSLISAGDYMLVVWDYPQDIAGESAWYLIGAVGTTPAGAQKSVPNAFVLDLTASIPTASICACDCPHDPQCDGVTNVLDVVHAVNVAFKGFADIPDPNVACPWTTTDVDCNGFTSVLDVVHFVNVAFRSGNPAIEFCNPCP